MISSAIVELLNFLSVSVSVSPFLLCHLKDFVLLGLLRLRCGHRHGIAVFSLNRTGVL